MMIMMITMIMIIIIMSRSSVDEEKWERQFLRQFRSFPPGGRGWAP